MGLWRDAPPAIDLAAEKRLIDCLVALAAERAVRSAHDVSDGGLAVSVAEACFGRDGLSAEISIDAAGADDFAEAALFGERGARAVVSVAPASLARVNEVAAQYKVRAQRIGTVTRGEFRIQYQGAGVIQGSIESFRRVWSESLPKAVEAPHNENLGLDSTLDRDTRALAGSSSVAAGEADPGIRESSSR